MVQVTLWDFLWDLFYRVACSIQYGTYFTKFCRVHKLMSISPFHYCINFDFSTMVGGYINTMKMNFPFKF